jgi:hypothetical protein
VEDRAHDEKQELFNLLDRAEAEIEAGDGLVLEDVLLEAKAYVEDERLDASLEMSGDADTDLYIIAESADDDW